MKKQWNGIKTYFSTHFGSPEIEGPDKALKAIEEENEKANKRKFDNLVVFLQDRASKDDITGFSKTYRYLNKDIQARILKEKINFDNFFMPHLNSINSRNPYEDDERALLFLKLLENHFYIDRFLKTKTESIYSFQPIEFFYKLINNSYSRHKKEIDQCIESLPRSLLQDNEYVLMSHIDNKEALVTIEKLILKPVNENIKKAVKTL